MGVMDFGSSAINLTVYDVSKCGDGHYEILEKTKVDTLAGKARSAEGSFSLGHEVRATLDEAVDSLIATLKNHKPDHVVATATSVFRDAEDGAEWCAAQLQKHGCLINLIDGDMEAKLSAFGALSTMTCDAGLVIDQGGGSLEIYNVATGQCLSYPFGVLSLMQLAEGSPLRAAQIVEEELRKIDWLQEVRGDLVVVGRAMRLLGKLLLGDDTRGKNVSRMTMQAVAVDLLTGRLDAAQIKMYPGYQDRLPYRGSVLQGVLNVCPLEKIKFADYALREGVFLTQTGRVK